MPHHELTTVVERVGIEDVHVRVQEAGKQHPAGAQYPEALPPHRRELRAEQVRHRVEHDVEGTVGEHAEVAHVTQYRAQVEPVPFGDEPVLTELPW